MGGVAPRSAAGAVGWSQLRRLLDAVGRHGARPSQHARRAGRLTSSHSDRRRGGATDRRVRRTRRPRADDPGGILSVGRHRRPCARGRDGPRRPAIRAHGRQPPECADRHRRRPPADRQRQEQPRSLLGAARRWGWQLRRGHQPALPGSPGPAYRLVVLCVVALVACGGRAGRVAGLGSTRALSAHLDLSPHRRSAESPP